MYQNIVYLLAAITAVIELAVSFGILSLLLSKFGFKKFKTWQKLFLVILPSIVAVFVTYFLLSTHSALFVIGGFFFVYFVTFWLLLNRFENTSFGKAFKVALVQMIIISVLSFLFSSIASMMFTTVTISDNSMSGTLNPGTQVLIYYNVKTFHRGDIVFMNDPDGTQMIRRIIGLPGETIEIKTGEVLANGSRLTQNYVPATFCMEPAEASGKSVTTLYGEPVSSSNFSNNDQVYYPNTTQADCNKPFVLDSDEYFVLADNPSTGVDSRQCGGIKSHFVDVKTGFISGLVLGKSGIQINF